MVSYCKWYFLNNDFILKSCIFRYSTWDYLIISLKACECFVIIKKRTPIHILWITLLTKLTVHASSFTFCILSSVERWLNNILWRIALDLCLSFCVHRRLRTLLLFFIFYLACIWRFNFWLDHGGHLMLLGNIWSI